MSETDPPSRTAVYGLPPAEVIAPVEGAAWQVSPLIPGAHDLAELSPGGLDEVIALAPPGTLERRFALAQALRVLTPGGRLTVAAPKTKGGGRLAAELTAFGCEVRETSRRHHRIVATERPAEPRGLDEAIATGAPRRVESLGLWSQPGVFSWDRPDPGTLLLLSTLPAQAGNGADLGCGIGVIAQTVLAGPKVTGLTLVDIDRRALDAARRNLDDPRVTFAWRDLREPPEMADLDFVVMNPPFHDGGSEDRALGQAFVRRASEMLRKGGVCWLVANRHLPYEAELAARFAKVELRAEAAGFKVYEARR